MKQFPRTIVFIALVSTYNCVFAQETRVIKQSVIGVNFENFISMNESLTGRYGFKISHEIINRLSITSQFNFRDCDFRTKNWAPEFYGPEDYMLIIRKYRGLGLGFDYRLSPFSKGTWNNTSFASFYVKGGITHQWHTSKWGKQPEIYNSQWVYYAGIGGAFYFYKNIGVNTELVFQETLFSEPWLNIGLNYRFHFK